jgi:hypothetical protein
MAKREWGTTAEGTGQQTENTVAQSLNSVAEGLGKFLGEAEAQWNTWRGQREQIVKNLEEIRDRATRMLQEAGVPLAAATTAVRRGRPAGTGTGRRGRPPGSGGARKSVKGAGKRTMSAETRQKMAAAAKARWEKRRAGKA